MASVPISRTTAKSAAASVKPPPEPSRCWRGDLDPAWRRADDGEARLAPPFRYQGTYIVLPCLAAFVTEEGLGPKMAGNAFPYEGVSEASGVTSGQTQKRCGGQPPPDANSFPSLAARQTLCGLNPLLSRKMPLTPASSSRKRRRLA